MGQTGGQMDRRCVTRNVAC